MSVARFESSMRHQPPFPTQTLYCAGQTGGEWCLSCFLAAHARHRVASTARHRKALIATGPDLKRGGLGCRRWCPRTSLLPPCERIGGLGHCLVTAADRDTETADRAPLLEIGLWRESMPGGSQCPLSRRGGALAARIPYRGADSRCNVTESSSSY